MLLLLLILLAGAAWRLAGGYPRPDRNYSYLWRSEVKILDSLGEVLFPAGGALTPGHAEAGIIDYTDRYFGWHERRNRTLMRLLLVLFEHGTLLFLPSWTRMSGLDRDRRLAYLQGWAESDLYLRRLAFESLRAILCMGYMSDATVQREMGIYRPANANKNALFPLSDRDD